jgi:hypothetical protein
MWDRFTAEDLAAKATYGAFVLPPGLGDEFSKLRELGEKERLENEIGSTEFPNKHDQEVAEEVTDRVVGEISWFLRHELPHDIPHSFLALNGFWKVSVTNEGSVLLEEVSLALPHASSWVIKPAAGPVHHDATEKTSEAMLDLGRLRPGESVEILAWTWREPNWSDEDDVRLTFAKGRGDVVFIGSARPVTSQRWPYFALGGLWLLLMAWLWKL